MYTEAGLTRRHGDRRLEEIGKKRIRKGVKKEQKIERCNVGNKEEKSHESHFSCLLNTTDRIP